jgi:hypothetical protein
LIIAAVAMGAWFAFGVIERLNSLETQENYLKMIYLEASTEQVPIDQEQHLCY